MSDSFKTPTARTAGIVAMTDLAAAEQFLAGHARVLDRRRFERLFRDGEAGPVRDAVAAYRNRDGGLGQGLEPDGRGPGSQGPAVAMGLRVLHEADAWDDDLVGGICDWLDAAAPPEGATTFVDPSVEGWPHAPWWQVQPELGPSMISAGLIVGILLTRDVRHPWIDRTVDWLRETAPTADSPYNLYGALGFADHEPGLAERLAPAIKRVSRSTPTLRARSTGRSGSPRGPVRLRAPSLTRTTSSGTWTISQTPSSGTAAGCSTSRSGRPFRRTTGAVCSPSTRC